MDISFRPPERFDETSSRHKSISSASSTSTASIMSVDSRQVDDDVDMSIPELSRSYESTRSFDLRTPIKPTYAPLGSLAKMSNATTRRQEGFEVAAGTFSSQDLEIAEEHLNGGAYSKSAQASGPRRTSEDSQAVLADRRSQLGLSLGLELRGLPPLEGAKAELVGSREPLWSESLLERRNNKSSAKSDGPHVGAHKLKINLPSAEPYGSNRLPLASGNSLYPQTPGGSLCSTARDGAVSGGPPISPFEPPTPLRAVQDARTSYWSPATNGAGSAADGGSQTAAFLRSPSTPTANIGRIGLQRVGSSPLSPLSTEFATSMSIKRPERRPFSRSGGSGGASSTNSSEAASMSGSSTSTALTPPFSPIALARSLPGESADELSKMQRTGTSGSASSTSSSKKRQSDAGHTVVRSLSATRSKFSKPAKVAPYPQREDLNLPPSPLSQPSSQSTADTSLGDSPLMLPTSLSVSQSLKSPVSGLKIPSSSPMTKSASAPSPKLTVSARHLSNHHLHADFARQYVLGDELGSGGFGFVVRATRVCDGFPVAVKFIFKDKVPNHGWVRDPSLGVIPMEAFVLKVVKHPGVVRFVDLFDDDAYFYLIMEHHGTPWQAPEPTSAKTPKNANESTPQEKTPKGMPTSSPMKTSKSQPSAVKGSPSFAIFPPESKIASPLKLDTALSAETELTSSPISPASAISPTRAESLHPAPMERRSSCDLFECIEQHSRLSENKARWVFAQIVEAVYHLDTMGITHRDIKDENCVIDADFNVKLIDFGSAVIADPRKPPPYFNRFFGTMTFASSEILQGQSYRAPQAEVWSLGVLLSILLSGEGPFADQDAAMRGKITRPKGAWSHDALNLLLGCLEVNPDRRATIAQVRDHPWVRSAWSLRGLRRPSS
ncbi:camk camkl pask protein kinase [Ceraceosorus bombacis]|uniref:Camk camkl pask protein kinase n=1 Tax=Ceraceosorus bombacis TaxID=401625 RepID=A0A0P1BJF9_9BASI|nr:camk camkl pask protein kinase [Ceraceosorus bombacis]